MQQAIPYSTFHHPSIPYSSLNNTPSSVSAIMVAKTVAENAVTVIGRRGCCMSHVVKRLLLSLGVNPGVFEVDDKDEVVVLAELEAFINGDKEEKLQFPVVFIGGRLFGGLDQLMASHISGELVPILKQAGALWL